MWGNGAVWKILLLFLLLGLKDFRNDFGQNNNVVVCTLLKLANHWIIIINFIIHFEG